MWLRELFKNLFEKDNNILLFGTERLCLSMNYFNDLVCFIFVIFDVIFKFPNRFDISTWSQFAYFNFQSFLFIYLIYELVVAAIAILADVKRVNILFFAFF